MKVSEMWLYLISLVVLGLLSQHTESTCPDGYTGDDCEIAKGDFLHWTKSFAGQMCPWETSGTNCAECNTGGLQCPYHTTPNVCVMNEQYSQNRYCCHSLGLYSTCDNEMWLYADGELIGHLDDWSKSIFRQIYSNVSVIGIKCLDWEGRAAILASFSDGTTSNTNTWNCSLVESNGWKLPDFVEDSDWKSAENLGNHGISPWGNVNGMNNAAQWIWYPDQVRDSDVSRTAYCRTKLAWDQLESCRQDVDEAVGTAPPTTTQSTTTEPTTTTPATTTTTPATTTQVSSSSMTESSTQTTTKSETNNVVGDTGAQTEDKDKGVNTGAVVGGTVGGILAAVALLSCILYGVLRRRRKKKEEEEVAEEAANEEMEQQPNSVPPSSGKQAWLK